MASDELMDSLQIKQHFEKQLNSNLHLGRKQDVFCTEESILNAFRCGFLLTQIHLGNYTGFNGAGIPEEQGVIP